MLKTVGLGIQDYEKIINDNVFYIDKTKFISEWWKRSMKQSFLERDIAKTRGSEVFKTTYYI